MAMRSINIDDDVFAHLQRHSEPLVDTPNDVLRRLLFGDEGDTRHPQARRPGSLMPLIEHGLIAAGDQVRHTQPRLRRTHEATVTADGWIELPDGRAFPKPSPALKEQIGTSIDGWKYYIHAASGRSLAALRDEGRQQGSPTPTP